MSGDAWSGGDSDGRIIAALGLLLVIGFLVLCIAGAGVTR